MKIAENCLVEFAYRIKDQAGKVFEDSEADGNITYMHGHREIQPRIEEALEGAKEGQEFQVVLEPDEGFGPYDPQQLVAIPRSELPPDAEIVPGDLITISLDAEDGVAEPEEIEMKVVELHPSEVYLDANHPLAGQQVTFEIKVISVRSASAVEVAEREAALEAEEGREEDPA